MDQNDTPIFACDMSSLTPAERRQHITTIREVLGAVQEIREQANGYSFHLENSEWMLMQTASFVIKEQLCCSFFHFKIEVEPDEDALWLSLTGPECVKPFIRMEIGEAIPDEVALEANFHHSENG